MKTRRYNSTQHAMRMRRAMVWRVVLVTVFLVGSGWTVYASGQQAPERWAGESASLAKQIAALAGPGPATLNVQNASSIATDQVAVIRRLLESSLKASGVPVRAATEGAAIPTAIRVTLSQTAQHGVWVAEVQQGAETKVAMLEVALGSSAAVQSTSAMTLRKQLMYSGAERILDAQVFAAGGDTELVVLTPARIVTFRQSGGQWVPGPISAMEHALPFPRDVRGELAGADGGMTAYLPGVVCDGAMQPGGMRFSCRASDDPWPIGTQRAFYVAGRNYFSGVLSPAYGGNLPAFYSAAEVARSNGVATVFSDVQGHVRMLDHGTQLDVTGSRDWGSELASVHSGCGTGSQVLVDAAGDIATDSLRAYEVNGHEAAAVSQALPLDGAVTAMHTSSDGAAAMAVVRTQTNTYEVWRVSLDCH